jgi:hypothetical protein
MELIQKFKDVVEYQYLKVHHLTPNRPYTIVRAARSPICQGNIIYLLLRNIYNFKQILNVYLPKQHGDVFTDRH